MSVHLEGIVANKEISFVFVGGKGGVGKTTSSAALACQLAFDRKVLLISTDPAHSLSDAFRQNFSGEPQNVTGVPNLHVMEVNPESFLREEIKTWASIADEAGMADVSLMNQIEDFQHWLVGIPGVDEATALSSVIGLIETGAYDVIVFDTAPTGHTLKLLQLPEIMQIGLNKIESWQSTIWNYWDMVKTAGGRNPGQLKKQVATRIRDYKLGIEKVGEMLKDQRRTVFVVVCIAEFLSISESQRLLQELVKHKVNATHVIVNQLIIESVAEDDSKELVTMLSGTPDLLSKVQAAIRLTSARSSIQQKYLKSLQQFPECRGITICKVPLLPREIAGAEDLLSLSEYLLPPGYRSAGSHPAALTDRVVQTKELYKRHKKTLPVCVEGDHVVIVGLNKSPHYNGKTAVVVKVTEDGRVAVRFNDDSSGKSKVLSLKGENVELAKTAFL
jgi:arsenite/tail-anchored protein-transporting ATPase